MLRSRGMTSARRPVAGALVIGGLVMIAVLAWWLRHAVEPDEPTAEPLASHPPPAASTARAPRSLPPLPTVPQLTPAPRPELRGHDMADPCTPVGELVIPMGYTTVTANDITVAWSPGVPATPGPSDIALRATSVAHLVTGIIEEATALTGAVRREPLTVVVYPATEFMAMTGTSAWASGAYDGAIRLPAVPRSELGISVTTLRHEVMHALLHAGVGCVPAWFNEGSAMYFAGEVPVLEWLSLLRAHSSLDLIGLQAPVFPEMSSDRAGQAYATSLAMVLFAIEHGGGEGLQPAVRAAIAAVQSSPRASLELWDRLVPGADDHAVKDLLARKLLGVDTGLALDDKLRGGVCCYGLRSPSDLACRSVAARPGSRTWSDRSGPRAAQCFTVPDTH
jgi:hypothetical protein